MERRTLREALAAAVEAAGADAGTLSQLLGDVLILVEEQAPPGRTLQSGHGYLVSASQPIRRPAMANDLDMTPSETPRGNRSAPGTRRWRSSRSR